MGPGIQCNDYVNGNIIKIKDHPKDGIKIHVSKREPYSKIESGNLILYAKCNSCFFAFRLLLNYYL